MGERGRITGKEWRVEDGGVMGYKRDSSFPQDKGYGGE